MLAKLVIKKGVGWRAGDCHALNYGPEKPPYACRFRQSNVSICIIIFNAIN